METVHHAVQAAIVLGSTANLVGILVGVASGPAFGVATVRTLRGQINENRLMVLGTWVVATWAAGIGTGVLGAFNIDDETELSDYVHAMLLSFAGIALIFGLCTAVLTRRT
jgi:hypothetical protein